MATYVLVQGAWGGPHGFRLVRPKLAAHGHQVFTPSLTGLGERSHLVSPEIRLSTHVRDVSNMLFYEDLTEVVLLGFSYGGFVVTGALEHIAERVQHLVYLDAFVPEDGESLADFGGAALANRVAGAEWLVKPIPRDYDDEAKQKYAEARQHPQPIGCFTEPVRLAKPLEDYPFSRTYIKATGEPRPEGGNAFWRAADHAKASPHWRYREIATNHMIPQNRPDELVEYLLELA